MKETCQVLLVCEISGRIREKGTWITEGKVRNWSKKRGIAGRRNGGVGRTEEDWKREHNKPASRAKRRGDSSAQAFRPSLPGGPRPPPAPAEPQLPTHAHLGAARSSPAATSPSSIPGGRPHSAKHKLCVR